MKQLTEEKEYLEFLKQHLKSFLIFLGKNSGTDIWHVDFMNNLSDYDKSLLDSFCHYDYFGDDEDRSANSVHMTLTIPGYQYVNKLGLNYPANVFRLYGLLVDSHTSMGTYVSFKYRAKNFEVYNAHYNDFRYHDVLYDFHHDDTMFSYIQNKENTILKPDLIINEHGYYTCFHKDSYMLKAHMCVTFFSHMMAKDKYFVHFYNKIINR